MGEIKIKKWDMKNTLKPTHTVLVVGKRGTGKSVILVNLLYALREKLDAVMVFSPTETAQGNLTGIVPPSMIHEEYSAPVLDAVLEMQRTHWRRGRGSHVCAVLDDCAWDKKIFRSKPLRGVFLNGRHNKMSCILSVQYATDFPPDLRTNCDYVIACRENITSNRKRLFDHFFGHFENLAAFNRCFKACTADYETLVLDNTSTSNNITDNVFWWRADCDLPPFRVGEKMWGLHERFARAPVATEDDDDDRAV